ncbi:uncharacterized protein F4812DRAFT_461554 [Daldinia caldariorum]|uniref:uncharacterized protein n=1 Tax=Daldinia caldariorum TaxID=326644 RepID=UPI002007AD68|nr:uncharacterized protein F4812DRAFT_461554 [Daldinia caldariorum]KAI1465867.1 hypothetical protein F4812DRAFT_461554 [Daldinia caldariorum]
MVSNTQANPNRIRDNQRRSRARRKEYIRSLEERLRLYKREGVEVTSHIQRAAQKIAEKYQKMRVLLNTLGFNDERIDCFLQNGSINPMETMSPDFSPPSTPVYTSIGMNITEPSTYDQANQTQGESTLDYTQGADQLPNGALAHNNHFSTSPGIQSTTIYDQAGNIAIAYLESPPAPAKPAGSTIAGSQVLATALQHCQNQINHVSSGNYVAGNSHNDTTQTLLQLYTPTPTAGTCLF